VTVLGANSCPAPYVDKAKWVINLSSRSLSNAQESLLKKGPNFAVTSVNISVSEIITKVESAVRSLNMEQAVTVTLCQAEPPKPSAMKEERDAIKSLKKDSTFMILLADKGCDSIVLDTDTYHANMSVLIETVPYQPLHKDPTDRLT